MQDIRMKQALLRCVVAAAATNFMCSKVQQKALSFSEARGMAKSECSKNAAREGKAGGCFTGHPCPKATYQK